MMGRQQYFQLLEQYNQLAAVEAQTQTASTAALPVVDRALGNLLAAATDAAMLFTGTAGALGILWSGSLVIIEAVPQLPSVYVDIADIVQGSAALGGLVTSVWSACRVLQPQRVFLTWTALLAEDEDYEDAEIVIDDAPAPFVVDESPRAIGHNESEANVVWDAALKLWEFTVQQREYEQRTGEKLTEKPWSRPSARKNLRMSRRQHEMAVAIWLDADIINDPKDTNENRKIHYADVRTAWVQGKGMLYDAMIERGYTAVNGGRSWLDLG